MERGPDPIPLCVDLDGTLIRTDLLLESFLGLVKRNPLLAARSLFRLRHGRAIFKQDIADQVDLDASVLPYDDEIIAWLRQERAGGRRIVLTTASNQKYARQVAEFVGLFDDVLASDATTNLSGRRKRDCLRERFGSGKFDYAGNSSADLMIWPEARNALLVRPERGVENRAVQRARVTRVFRGRGDRGAAAWRAIRPYQWLKNLLLFVPLIAAHRIGEIDLIATALVAFFSFSFCASSAYVANDLLDLRADRYHPRKRLRPFAAGVLSVTHGVALSLLLLVCGVGLAGLVSPAFLATVLLYYALTVAYSLAIKNRVVVDIILLAGLYTLRIIAGGVAVQIVPTFWLLAFSMFIFLSLALVKRYSEVAGLKDTEQLLTMGRGYRQGDLPTLLSLGTASGYTAVLVLALYINSSVVVGLYERPMYLWGLLPLMLYWVSRLWVGAGRGKIDDDPLLFALRDNVSRAVAAAAALILWLAS
jgi:4-hydroxybenzoate polyprenyltransferase/phosphoserine phosphatase